MSLTSFPGAFFLVSAAITVPVLLIFAWFYWQVRKEQLEELNESLAEEGEAGGDSLNLQDDGESTDSDDNGDASPEYKERY